MDAHDDVVARFIGQWRARDPNMRLLEMAVVGRLSRCSRAVERLVKANFANLGMEAWEFDMLASIVRSGPPYRLNPSELSELSMIGLSTVTHRVDKLAQKGWVTRFEDPTNRRRQWVEITAEGMDTVTSALPHHLLTEQNALHAFTEEDKIALNALLSKLLASLEPGSAR